MLLRSFFIALSQSSIAAKIIAKKGMDYGFAKRFVAGETLDEALDVVKELNKKGITASLDALGENVSSEKKSKLAMQRYIKILEEIKKRKAKANVSLKLTQMGLDISEDVCLNNVRTILKKAKQFDNFVRIDMEGSDYTQTTLDIIYKLKKRYDNVGAVIQSYLYRSADDVEALDKNNIKIRLCKGAYNESPEIAFKKKRDNNSNYVKLMKSLLQSKKYHAIATHDEKIIEATKKFAEENKISKKTFEFQMLYGIRRDLQSQLAEQGYNIRVYVPFGKEWFPYFMRRLAERPANVSFVLKSVMKEVIG